jgi:hypothetical protein
VHRHRLHRAALHLPPPGQERGPFYYSDRLLENPYSRCTRLSARSGVLLIVALAIAFVFFQSACSKKNKVAIPPISGVQIALLPFNIPSGNQDLRWTAMAGPIMMAKVSEYAGDIEVIPLWQSMPVTLETGGASRSFTAESAAYIASFLAAEWSAMGEMSPTKSGVSMMIDFIPPRSTQVPFRFQKSGKIDDVGSQLPAAFNQFFYYLAAKPLAPIDKKLPTMTAMKSLAEVLDREYGWSVEANPGQANEAVANLIRTDERLARMLFNPALYPALAPTK